MEGTKIGSFFKPYPTTCSSPMFTQNDPNNWNDNQQPPYDNIRICSLASSILLEKLPPLPSCPLSTLINGVEVGDNIDDGDGHALKARIMSHPRFPHLLHSYIECFKVGAPPEVEASLTATWKEFEARQELDQFRVVDPPEVKEPQMATWQEYETWQRSYGAPKDPQLDQFMVEASPEEAVESLTTIWPEFEAIQLSYEAPKDPELDQFMAGAPPEEAVESLTTTWPEFGARKISYEAPKDDELDQFMEAYCDVLEKYKEELARPLKEAMEFIRKIESQLNTISQDHRRLFPIDERAEDIGPSDKAQDNDNDNDNDNIIVGEMNRTGEVVDQDLKKLLLRKYRGHLSTLKQEVSKNRKVGKLPKHARLKLLNWWESHSKWPYPSESEKAELEVATGLDQKQISNWFINQRKRHWEPPQDLQFLVQAINPCYPNNITPSTF